MAVLVDSTHSCASDCFFAKPHVNITRCFSSIPVAAIPNIHRHDAGLRIGESVVQTAIVLGKSRPGE